MITVNNMSLQFAGRTLFKDVDLKFTPGNCYGVIGANGAGKSTFLKILSGEIESTTGEIAIPKNIRMSVLKQDHFQYDECEVLQTVIRGNARLYEIMQEKEALYAKEDFSDADGERAAELEGEFAELNGWEADSDASQILQGLGIGTELHYALMKDLKGGDKVKVLLAQALFGQPGILLLDEPTNHLDIESVNWLEDFLLDFPGTVIVVSHDRHFLNTVCTHTVDIDFGKIKMYVGNYDFWYESSQMMQHLMKAQNKKKEDQMKELQNFITRFSANKSKAKQATSRRKLLDKISLEEMPASSRRYPFVQFKPDREVGNEILTVEGISKTIEGIKVLNNVSFRMNKDDKIVLVGENEMAGTTLLQILIGEMEPDEGSFKWGVTTSQSYFPKDNSEFFNDCDLDLINWLRQFSDDQSESYLRGFLGRMLFSGEEALKPAKVLSGGEKVRCMLSRMMLSGANVVLLDQPTNHLDLESITALNNGLIDFKGNVLFTSHDHQFIQTIANRVIELTEDGLIDRTSTYDEYLEFKKANK
ncbi:ABC transporter ATP-binding protein [Sporanaerobium hydrogeniformans]|uniref:ABC transporter ATP-binding protein n=1 Tax=Sporanaerobium hydrogeniformans TaxID=3072179 RepID=A0AC61DG01_9FIRM|nr:ABC-F family ATP-binding cassette domain-containing protein [Sporanaerobium hydrogeniformans]PHV71711.1 ABC transporter ATP-binding protein [Sporanaerobium hydrogeniformans]